MTFGGEISDWGELRPGDVVHVRQRDGDTYIADVDMRTIEADIVWVWRHGFRVRHMLCSSEGDVMCWAEARPPKPAMP
jgi:hypothetical protein